jgi:hypothetical protein
MGNITRASPSVAYIRLYKGYKHIQTITNTTYKCLQMIMSENKGITMFKTMFTLICLQVIIYIF